MRLRRTTHLWLVVANDGVVLHAAPDLPAAFFTRDEAKRWAHNNCSFPPRIVKFAPVEPA